MAERYMDRAAVDGLSFGIQKNQCYGLFGLNGENMFL